MNSRQFTRPLKKYAVTMSHKKPKSIQVSDIHRFKNDIRQQIFAFCQLFF